MVKWVGQRSLIWTSLVIFSCVQNTAADYKANPLTPYKADPDQTAVARAACSMSTLFAY